MQKKNTTSYYITLIDSSFYKILKLLTRYPLEQVSSSFKVKGEKRKIIPCTLDAKKALKIFKSDIKKNKKILF